jgi:hypothetical protein
MGRKRSKYKPEPDHRQLSLFFDESSQIDSFPGAVEGVEDVKLTCLDSSTESQSGEQELPPWRLYERIVAAIEAENADFEMSITPNARIIGCLSGRKRQVDVLIDARWEDNISRRILVDAKRHKRKIDIKDVEAFEAMMKDCRAERGILVCPNGFTEGAKRRVQDAITINILTLDEVDDLDLTSWDECLGQCADQACNQTSTGMVLWAGYELVAVDPISSVVYRVGKCDKCHNFHVWCWQCCNSFALKDMDEHKCNCGRLWATIHDEGIDDKTKEKINTVRLLMYEFNQLWCIDQRRLI